MIIKNGKRIDGVSLDTIPVGTISPYLGATAPQGYLLCQGQKVSKTRYKQLYNICKSLFGTETDTEFYLPDLRGKTITGYQSGDSTFGTLGGVIGNLTHIHTTGSHALTVAEIPGVIARTRIAQPGEWSLGEWASHNPSNEAWTSCLPGQYGLDGGDKSHNHGNTGATSTLQPSMNLNWMVKAEMIVENGSKVYNGLDSSSTIDALSAAQGKALNDKIVQYSTYSTKETVIGVWTNEDGTKQTLYRKVVYLGNLPNATTKTIPHNISSLKMVTKFYGTFYATDYSTQAGLPYVVSNENQAYFPYQIAMDINQTNIVVMSGVDRSTYKGQVTIEYTKN